MSLQTLPAGFLLTLPFVHADHVPVGASWLLQQHPFIYFRSAGPHTGASQTNKRKTGVVDQHAQRKTEVRYTWCHSGKKYIITTATGRE